MFDLEWTGRSYTVFLCDVDAAFQVAAETAAQFGFDPAECFAAHVASEGEDRRWSTIETAAFQVAFDGWRNWPENVSLIWRN